MNLPEPQPTQRILRKPLREWPAHSFSLSEGAALYMLAYLGSAVLGIVRQILFNAHFGVGAEASAFYAAFRLPDAIATLLAGGALTNALVPLLARTNHADNSAATSRLVSLTLTVLLAALIPLVALGMLLTPLFVRYVLAPGFDEPNILLTSTLTRLLLLQVVLSATEGVLVAVLTSRGRLLLPAVAIVFGNLTLIAGILAAMRFPQLGIYGPVVGAIGEALVQIAVLLPGLRRERLRLRPAWGWADDRNLRDLLRLLVPSGLSGVVNYGGSIVETAFASLARQATGLAALQNVSLLSGLPVRLLGMAIGQSSLPHLAEQATAGQWSAYRATLRRALLVALGLAVLGTVALTLLGRITIRILFERGRFDAAAGDLTYNLLAAAALGLPAAVAIEIMTRALVTLYDTRTPLITNLLQLALRISMLIPLVPAIGVIALPLVTVATNTAEALVLGLVLWLKLKRRADRH